MFKNVASQKITVFAFDSTTNLPKSGDSANITAYVSKDDGTVTVLTDTSATEQDATNAKGYYIFDLAQAETNGDKLTFSAKSSTANIVVIAQPAVVYTLPASFTSFVTPPTAAANATAVRSELTTELGRLDAAVTTRMATFAQPTGFLAATFPATIASTTNITAGTIATVSGSVGSVTGLTASDVGAIKTRVELALPNAAAGASGGLAVLDTNLAVKANVVRTGTTYTGTTTTTIFLSALTTDTSNLVGCMIRVGDSVSVVTAGTDVADQVTISPAIAAAASGQTWYIYGTISNKIDSSLGAYVSSGTETGQLKTTAGKPWALATDGTTLTSGGGATDTAAIAAIKLQTDKITTQRIEIVSHVNNTDVVVNQGETYSSTLNALTFTLASGDSWPSDLTGYTITLIANQTADTAGNQVTVSPASISQGGTVVTATGASREVRVDATAAQTVLYTPGLYEYQLKAVSGATTDWLRQGQLRVVDSNPNA